MHEHVGKKERASGAVAESRLAPGGDGSGPRERYDGDLVAKKFVCPKLVFCMCERAREAESK